METHRLSRYETQLHQLLSDDKFIHAQYLPSGQTDIDEATVTSVLGMRVQASTLVPNGTAYALDTYAAAVEFGNSNMRAQPSLTPAVEAYCPTLSEVCWMRWIESTAVGKCSAADQLRSNCHA